ncbi:MAG TPA: DUF4268 domain-containing protein [Pyrinomonadaceae bacterium]|nr:DUF4268 domain-containing protein [Pyrinomonadaceae bacterium]
MIELGRLKRVEARDVWANEASHFTPWLAEEHNLALLGEAIGIELEHEATEQSVGPFSADILCKDTATGDYVLIENQLERTDHRHLGQLITYASGLKAVTIVWIANPFTPEHRAALDWLNEITDRKFNFFGLEVELWRIGDSVAAPKFNVIAKPNAWSKTVSEGVARVENEALTPTKQLQLEYWTMFSEYVASQQSTIRTTKPSPQNWMNLSIGRSGFGLVAVASTWNTDQATYEIGELKAEIVITDPNNKIYFERLMEEKGLIENELGYELNWYSPEKSSKVHIRKTADIQDRGDWPSQFAWLLSKLEDLRRVFGERIKML